MCKAKPRHNIQIDCFEIDVTKHATLNAHGLRVVGMDFLQMKDASQYSAIIMNPPFSAGAQHVLKAWEVLWDGEIAAIINAETVRNPCDRYRQRLVTLIEECGRVEFVQEAFMDVDAQRKTTVEVALVYLRKTADASTDFLGNLLDDLKEDQQDSCMKDEYEEERQLALPRTEIQSRVAVFDAAVRSTKESIKAQAKADYYTNLLGQTMAVLNGDSEGSRRDTAVSFVQATFAKAYDELKDRAWASILRSSDVTNRLSSGAQRKLESEFAIIKRLEFSVNNVLGFLHGIVMSQGDIQVDMACEVFDLITRYYSDNTSFYRGWKSNDKHRTVGRRLKKTRFILPNFKATHSGRSLDSAGERRLADFDKVFAMLDGKFKCEVGLKDLFQKEGTSLAHGERLASTYFEVRWYPGAGTIHFFPKSQEFMDRLNRTVGRHRQWLPTDEGEANADFWKQYNQADALTKKLDENFARNRFTHQRCIGRTIYHDLNSSDDDVRERAEGIFDKVQAEIHESVGINVDRMIEKPRQAQQLLLAA